MGTKHCIHEDLLDAILGADAECHAPGRRALGKSHATQGHTTLVISRIRRTVEDIGGNGRFSANNGGVELLRIGERVEEIDGGLGHDGTGKGEDSKRASHCDDGDCDGISLVGWTNVGV